MINIICGCPGSGKTTYLKRNIAEGDLVVDVAWLYSAISGQQGPIKKSNLLNYTLNIRNALYDEILKNKEQTAWILAGAPLAEDRQSLADMFNADVHLISKTRQECIDQVTKDEARQSGLDDYLWLVNYWHDKYTPRSKDILIYMT